MDDPIVDEIHKMREKLLTDCGGDLRKLLALYKAQERQDLSRVVTSVKAIYAKDKVRL